MSCAHTMGGHSCERVKTHIAVEAAGRSVKRPLKKRSCATMKIVNPVIDWLIEVWESSEQSQNQRFCVRFWWKLLFFEKCMFCINQLKLMCCLVVFLHDVPVASTGLITMSVFNNQWSFNCQQTLTLIWHWQVEDSPVLHPMSESCHVWVTENRIDHLPCLLDMTKSLPQMHFCLTSNQDFPHLNFFVDWHACQTHEFFECWSKKTWREFSREFIT